MVLTWQQQFTLLLTKYYTPAEASRASAVLLPAILNDFKKMLSAASADREITESYNTEDGKTVIKVRGKKIKHDRTFSLIVTALLVSDVPLQFSFVPGFGRCLVLESGA